MKFNADRQLIIRIGVTILIAKLVGVGALYFLPKTGIEQSRQSQRVVPYHPHRYSDLAGLENNKKQVAQKPTEELYKLDNLELKAIYSESGQGFIIVSEKNKPDEAVIIANNEEYKGYKLIRLLPAEAIFERGGKKYNLRLTEKETKGLISAPAASTSSQQNDDEDIVRVVARKNVDYYSKNFKAIWQNIKIDEIKKNGKITGFEIKNIEENSVFARLGLKKGDIITKVNNMVIKSYADAFNIYKNVRDVSSLKITVIRDNQEKDLEYEVF